MSTGQSALVEGNVCREIGKSTLQPIPLVLGKRWKGSARRDHSACAGPRRGHAYRPRVPTATPLLHIRTNNRRESELHYGPGN